MCNQFATQLQYFIMLRCWRRLVDCKIKHTKYTHQMFLQLIVSNYRSHMYKCTKCRRCGEPKITSKNALTCIFLNFHQRQRSIHRSMSRQHSCLRAWNFEWIHENNVVESGTVKWSRAVPLWLPFSGWEDGCASNVYSPISAVYRHSYCRRRRRSMCPWKSDTRVKRGSDEHMGTSSNNILAHRICNSHAYMLTPMKWVL